jgi:hypothetical protein
MDVKVGDVRKLIKDITEYADKSYSRTLQHPDNKDVVSNWILALNTMIPDNTNIDTTVANTAVADSVVADDQLIDEKYNFRYQSIYMYFSLAKIQDRSVMSYASAAKIILETLKTVLDKQIEAKQIEDKQMNAEQMDADTK